MLLGKLRNVYLEMLFISLQFFCLLLPRHVEAGMDRYSNLDRLGNWLIERKFDSDTSEVSCRASIPGYYSWFGGRIRLNKEGELVIPPDLSDEEPPSIGTLNKVRRALIACRSDLIYSPHLDF